ncbi:carboxypeptidase-like regulatory domain-containing protein [Flavobacterium sp. K5-23]|uniref:TonB-dependent receptor n=1 Tax=Flavobacterium sp. K5-23 TaxID=2746225 RepID=UPI00201000AC|nr:carboxypeptidase-like regulatory domain-containing protein [Flavobacterium sp. K5-23]UQD57135.1 TonB-dependent receptor [Flavobacterium sp. K5-23]
MEFNKWVLYFLLLLGSISYAQKATDKIPLTGIMATIEKQFNVKFSYAVEDVSGISIEKPATTLSLQQTIDYLNAKVLLNFKALDDRYVTVSVLNKRISIAGVILSDDSKTPLNGATITADNQVAISNKKGAFSLSNIPVTAIITISYIGYEPREFRANELFSNQTKPKEILLKPSNEELNQVLINVYLTPGLQKYLDGSTVLNTKKFGILPGLIEPDVLQSVQALPGVESTNESIANINVRGGTNDQNLMIWDNIKMYHSGHFFGLISAYNPNLTNKVIVTKNGTSAEYSDGVSSTINMFTNDEVSNAFSGGAGINLINADAFLAIPIAKNLEIDISGRRSITDISNTPTFTNYYKRSFQDSEINAESNQNNTNSDFYFYDYTAKILFDLNEKHQFRANLIGINNALDYTEYNADKNNSETKASTLSQKNIGYGGNWKAQWNSKFSTYLISYFSKYNIDATDYRIETDQRLTVANEVLETGVKLNTNYKATPNFNLLAGYEFNETGMLNQTTVSAPSYSSTKKDVLHNHGLFAQGEYNKNNTYLRIGVRLNYFQKFEKLLVEPRINIRQQLSNQFALKLEGEFKNQTATQIVDFEDDFLGVEKRRWVLVNNESIPIATSKQGSFGVEFNANKLNIDLTGFYKIVDGITASNQGFYNNFQYEIAHGSYTAKGIEFLANKTAGKYSTWLSYTFSINNYEFDSFTPPTFPNNVDIRHSVSLGFNYDVFKNFKLSVGGIWRNGQPYTVPLEGKETVQNGNTTMVNYDSPNSKNLDDFMRLDASCSYQFNFATGIKGILRAGVINTTNEDNVINRYYKVDPNNSSKTIKVDNKSLGMTPNVSFRVNF